MGKILPFRRPTREFYDRRRSPRRRRMMDFTSYESRDRMMQWAAWFAPIIVLGMVVLGLFLALAPVLVAH